MGGTNNDVSEPQLPRAEEIVAEVYATIRAIRERGAEPSQIVLPLPFYRVLQEYRAQLGELPDGFPDYLGRYELFGVPIYTDGRDQIVIRTRK